MAFTIVLALAFPFPILAQSAQQLSGTSNYVPTPPPRIADPTLEPVAADEPVPPAGFPPLPDRFNLSAAIASAEATGPRQPGTAPNAPGRAPSSSYHQGYGHVPAGAYTQSRQPGGPSSAGVQESFNVNNTSATATSGKAPMGQATPQLPNLPAPVVVSQSTTQDLSLPDDEFSDQRPPKRRNNMGSYAGNMLRGYMFGAAGMAAGMGMSGLRY